MNNVVTMVARVGVRHPEPSHKTPQNYVSGGFCGKELSLLCPVRALMVGIEPRLQLESAIAYPKPI